MKQQFTKFKQILKVFKHLAIVGTFVVAPFKQQAQTLNYSFSQQNGTYSAITGTVLSSGATMDDATFAFTLPFTFNFNGTNYTNIFVSENGYVSFGTTNPGTTCRSAISSIVSGFQVASAMSSDLQGINASSDLRISVTGVAPNRTFIAQWTNQQFYLGAGQSFNFQITLDETTNLIKFIYGGVTNTGSGTLQVGLRGNTNANFQNRTSTTNWTTSVFGTLNSDAMTISSTVSPTIGLTYVWAAPGAALNFDGVGDQVTLPTAISTSLSTNNKITVEAWVRPTSLPPGAHTILGNYGTPNNQAQFFLRATSTNYQFYIGNSSTGVYTPVFSAASPSVGIWQHVAGVWNGSVSSVYINGVLSATAAVTYPNFGVTTNSLVVGLNAVPENFYGDIDEVRIWNRPLCQSEIQNNMNGEIATTANGLMANYHFNQGIAANTNTSVTTLIDASGNAYTGTLTGIALTGSVSNWVSPGGVLSGSNVAAFISPTVAISGSSVICSGSSTTLTASGNVSTYVWTSGPTTASYAVTPSVTTTYSVVGTNSVGCQANMVTQSVVVNSTPTISVNNGTICVGNSFTINPSGANTYTIQGGSAVVSPTANASYTVVGTSSVGCVSANTATSNVTANALPIVSVNSGTICAGNTFTISPTGASTYTIQGGSAAVSPTANISYTVVGTSSAGCVSANTATSNVTVNSLPIVSVNSGAICNGSSFTIVASGANTYSYSGGSAVVSPTANANYTVTGTNSVTSCSNTAVSSVTVNALPTVSAASNSSLLCIGQSATLTASGATTYTWNTSATTAVIAISPTINTTYTVNGTGANGCSNTAVITQSVSTCTGIQSAGVNQQLLINVYPNPSTGVFNLVVTNEMVIEVSDILGKVVLTEKLNVGNYTLNLVNNTKGIYIIKASVNGQMQTLKIIKE